MRGPEGPRGSAVDDLLVPAYMAARGLPQLILVAAAARPDAQQDVDEPMAPVAEALGFVVVGEQAALGDAALRARPRAFLLTQDSASLLVRRNLDSDWLIHFRHNDLLGRIDEWGRH